MIGLSLTNLVLLVLAAVFVFGFVSAMGRDAWELLRRKVTGR